MERRFQYYVPFTNHTQYRARARAREHNNTMEYFILNFTIFFTSMSTSYVRMHIYIEDMRTKKALSERSVKIANSNFMPTLRGFRW